MKKFIKSILGKKVSRFFSFYMNKEYMPFTYKSLVEPESNYSDFFIYNTKFFKNVFIAENTFSLLNLKKLDVIHKLDFYSKEGNYLKTIIYKSKDFLSKIELPKFNSNEEYISFIHETKLDPKKNNLRNIDKTLKFVLQHRGYSIFFKNKNSIGSIVHGNFGAITPSNKNNIGAIIRKKKIIHILPCMYLKKEIHIILFLIIQLIKN